MLSVFLPKSASSLLYHESVTKQVATATKQERGGQINRTNDERSIISHKRQALWGIFIHNDPLLLSRSTEDNGRNPFEL